MRTIIEYMQLCSIHFYQKIARKKVAWVNAAKWLHSSASYGLKKMVQDIYQYQYQYLPSAFQ